MVRREAVHDFSGLGFRDKGLSSSLLAAAMRIGVRILRE